MYRTRNLEWDVSFYWEELYKAFENWYVGEVLEIWYQGQWVLWNESDRERHGAGVTNG